MGMKRIVSVIAMLALLTGCGGAAPAAAGGETAIVLSDAGITVNGGGETKTVYTSRDIVYYEDRDFYASGNPYGEGGEGDKHAAEEAEAHRVVNITAPGTYRVSGTLSAGQIRVDLGEEAYEDKSAVVKLILDGADISCTVAPAILFLNVYECDGDWDADTASARVDTKDAGAVLVLVCIPGWAWVALAGIILVAAGETVIRTGRR